MVVPLDSVQVAYNPPTEYPDNEQDKPIDGLALVSPKLMTPIVIIHLISRFNLANFFHVLFVVVIVKTETKGEHRGLVCT